MEAVVPTAKDVFKSLGLILMYKLKSFENLEGIVHLP